MHICGVFLTIQRNNLYRATPTLMTHVCLNAGDSVSHNAGEKLTIRPKGHFIGAYSIVTDYGIEKAAQVVYEAMPTLMVLIANIERQNLVRIRTTVIAKKLNVSIATVERHMAKLRKLRIIEPDAAEGDKKSAVFNWRVCPFLGWTGHTDSIWEYVQQLPKDHPWFEYADPAAFPFDSRRP